MKKQRKPAKRGMKKKVWNVLYTRIDKDTPFDSCSTVDTFSTKKEAMDKLNCEYESTISEIESGKTVLDCVKKENHGTNAIIQLGVEPQFDWDDLCPEVVTQHEWRIYSQTIKIA